MKVYNIKDSRSFFQKLAECEGCVEVVNEEGMHLQITAGKEDPELIPMTYIQGGIREMELRFQKLEDCRNILAYLVNTRGLTA